MLLMAKYGIKASDVESKASGPKGLLKQDIIAFIDDKGLKPIQVADEAPAGAAAAPAAKKPAKPKSGFTDHPLSSMRSVIARRLTDSKQTSPHGHCTAATDLAGALRVRADHAQAGVKVSLNDLVIKAAATALQHVPEINLNVNGEDFEVRKQRHSHRSWPFYKEYLF